MWVGVCGRRVRRRGGKGDFPKHGFLKIQKFNSRPVKERKKEEKNTQKKEKTEKQMPRTVRKGTCPRRTILGPNWSNSTTEISLFFDPQILASFRAQIGTSRDAISKFLSGLFMAFFSRLFGSFAPPREGRANPQRLGRKPIFPLSPGQLSSQRANRNSKKEWGPLTVRRKGKKEGPTTTETKKQPRERSANSPSREGRGIRRKGQNHTKKTGPIPTRRMTGQPHPEKAGPTTPPR